LMCAVKTEDDCFRYTDVMCA